jgi:hypothetical protein
MKKLKHLLLFCLLVISSFSFSVTWKTVSTGFWNNPYVWSTGTVPPYSSADTFLIRNPVAITNDLFFQSGAFVKIDSSGGICGHYNATVFSGAKILKHGILELDSLKIPGGQVTCLSPGEVILTQYGIITAGGSLTVNGCSLSVGPWFECIQPAYSFIIGIEEPNVKDPIKIFPNPGNGVFELRLDTDTKFKKLIVSDLWGRTCFEQTIENNSENSLFDISLLKNGLYIWTLMDDTGRIQGKLLLQK